MARKRQMNQFIGALKIPCYDAVKYYNFYDVLEALSRCLFQGLLVTAQKELLAKEEAELSESDESQRAGVSGGGTARDMHQA